MERKAEHEKLLHTASELQAVLVAFPDLYFWLDPDGRILDYHAERFSDLYVPPAMFLGKRMEDVLPPEVGNLFRDAFLQVGNTGSLVVVEYSLPLEGEEKFFEARVLPLLGDQLLVIARDITESKRAQVALRKSEERHRVIVEHIDEVIYRVAVGSDPFQGDVQYVSNQVENILGYKPDEFLHDPGLWSRIAHPDDARELAETMQRLLSTREKITRFYRLRNKKTNEYVWLEDRVVPQIDDQGNVIGLQGMARDITQRKRAEEALLKSEERYRSLLRQSGEGIFIFDPLTKRIQEANPILLSMLGYTEKEVTTLTLYDIVAASRESVDNNLEALLQTGRIYIPARQYKHKSGSLLDVEVRASLVSFSDSKIVLANITDISERKRAEAVQSALYRIAEITSSAEDLQEFYKAIHNIVGELMYAKNFYIALYDSSNDLLSFPYFVDEFDPMPSAQRPGRGLTEYVLRTGEPLLATPEKFEELVRQGEAEEQGAPSLDWLGVPLKTADRTFGVLVVQSYTEAMRYGEKEKDVLTFVSRHIASALERKRAEETIRHHAYHDVLTLLPNRMLFKDRFLQALAQARRNQQMLAMLFLDLDRFKLINDTLGHAVGDKLLQGVAKRLTSCLREGDTIARLGGDEFMVLVPGMNQAEDVVKVADKILKVLKPAFLFDGHELHITTSIGISLFPHDGEDAETLVKNSDIALYRAKECGRNNYQLYTPSMNARAFELLALENSLRRALEREEFILHYQPLVNIRTGKMVGMEALVRWNGYNGRLIHPAEFISLTEDTGLIVPLGEWVLHAACKQNRQWQSQGLPSLAVAVNLSARQFQHNLIETVARALKDTKLEPRFLELELTESVIMQFPDTAAEILRELKAMGIQICIDDFGTGYSSLSYLKRFPIHLLKIDQSFVRDSLTDADDAAIVTAIISMAHSLKLKVVAEGVETEAQLAFLRSHKCDIVQGFLFSYPVSSEEFESLLSQDRQLVP